MQQPFNRLVFEGMIEPTESPIEVHVEGFESDEHPNLGVLIEVTVRGASEGQPIVACQQLYARSWSEFRGVGVE